MMQALITIFYMISAVLFIRGIKLLGKAETAAKGNLTSAVGMLIAVLTVLVEKDVLKASLEGYIWIVAAVALGSIIGFIWSKKAEMTGMPQLVALFNGFGGLSSFLVAIAQYLTTPADAVEPFAASTLAITVAIGAVTFTGSVVAWGKLDGKFFKKNLKLPAKNAINAV